jgi:hypothetical protein
MTAPGYSERRSRLAKQLGLGRGRRASGEEPEPVASENPASTAIGIAAATKVSVGDLDLRAGGASSRGKDQQAWRRRRIAFRKRCFVPVENIGSNMHSFPRNTAFR